MIAEVISIGDELTSGQRLDTNSQWLSERLGELGVTVMYHTTVADDLDANVRVFQQALDRADAIVVSGGLGPTADDLTREALAKVLGVALELDQASLDYIRSLFARRKREMPERNVVQAMFPQGTKAIFNPQGTAPGIELTAPREGRAPARLFALPGVPAEMKEMWLQTVAPAIAASAGARHVIRHLRIKCFGVGESDLEQMLPDLIRRGRVPQVGITVSGATITLRITAAAATPEACLASMDETVATIRQCLGSIVFGEEDDELEHVVSRLLVDRNVTLATAECGTGGLIAHWLNEAGLHEGRYLGGTVIGGIKMPGTGEEVARAMAEECRRTFGADYGLAMGEFPRFDPDAKEPGQVSFALATPDKTTVKQTPFAGHPSILKTRCAKQAMNLLRLTLLP